MNKTEKLLERIQQIGYDTYGDVDSKYWSDIQFQVWCAVSEFFEQGADCHESLVECYQHLQHLKKIVKLERSIPEPVFG